MRARPYPLGVCLLLAVHAGLLGYSGAAHSPVPDEVGHLPSGISHWLFGRFDLYRVNPPLVRSIAALPVLAAGAEHDWSSWREGADAFWRWLKAPHWNAALLAGFALGMAELTKSTWIVLFPLWPMLWWMCRWRHAAVGVPAEADGKRPPAGMMVGELRTADTAVAPGEVAAGLVLAEADGEWPANSARLTQPWHPDNAAPGCATACRISTCWPADPNGATRIW